MGTEGKAADKLVIGVGVVMIVLGVAAYFLTGRSSVTAMIPSFFGVALVVCGAAAAKFGRPAIIAAFIIGLLGIGGPLGRVVPDAIKNGLTLNAATNVQLLFAALSAVMVVVLLTRKSSKG